jgi:hypothetical protein
MYSSPSSLLNFKHKSFQTLKYFPHEINEILGMLAGVINHTVVALMRRQESCSEVRVHSSLRPTSGSPSWFLSHSVDVK